MALLDVKKLGISFGGLRAVDEFSIQIEDICQFLFGQRIQKFCSRLSGSFVHAHVQFAVKAEGESTFRVVKMV